MKIESACLFLNVSSPFNVLNGLCTGEVEFQAIIAENKNGEMVLDCLEVMDTANVSFAGNKIDVMGYEEYQEWTKQVNTLFGCDIDQLIMEDAEANIDKAYLLEYADKIQIPNQKPSGRPVNPNSNRNCCCC